MRHRSHFGGRGDSRLGSKQRLDHRATLLTPFEMTAQVQFFSRIQLAVYECAQGLEFDSTAHHGVWPLVIPSARASPARLCISLPRARAILDRPVPTGQPTTSAISWYEKPSTSHIVNTIRISSGRRASAFTIAARDIRAIAARSSWSAISAAASDSSIFF